MLFIAGGMDAFSYVAYTVVGLADIAKLASKDILYI